MLADVSGAAANAVTADIISIKTHNAATDNFLLIFS